jgi:hypothetical protein
VQLNAAQTAIGVVLDSKTSSGIHSTCRRDIKAPLTSSIRLVKTHREPCSFRFEVTELPHVENALCSATSNEQLAKQNGLQ